MVIGSTLRHRGTRFTGATVDDARDVIVAGWADGGTPFDLGGSVSATGPYDFGDGALVNGAVAGNRSALLVKYDAYGNALWARSIVSGAAGSSFEPVAVDSSAAVYAAGYSTGNGILDYGDRVRAAGSAPDGANVLAVKYAPGGSARWARTLVARARAGFSGVAVDPAGNAIAVGCASGKEQVGFGDDSYIAGAAPSTNPIIVKYDPDGAVLWAPSATSGASNAEFDGGAVDAAREVSRNRRGGVGPDSRRGRRPRDEGRRGCLRSGNRGPRRESLRSRFDRLGRRRGLRGSQPILA